MGKSQADKNWQVYMIHCSDGSLYTGITTDMDRRFVQHAEGRGAKYFRGRAPVSVVYLERDHSRSTASRRELELKSLNVTQKRALIAQNPARQRNKNNDGFSGK
jgi:putative endonuclease